MWLTDLFRKPVGLLDTKPKKLTAAALMGATAAVTCSALLDRWEGNRTVPYQDVIGIWTNCRGNTKDVDPTHVMTKAECDSVNEQQLISHARPVIECVPALTRHPNALAASVSLAYNIGPNAFCRSTAAKKFSRGDIRGGCDALLMFNRAGGRVVAGLNNRRKAERAICLRDV
jgi:lysozyme